MAEWQLCRWDPPCLGSEAVSCVLPETCLAVARGEVLRLCRVVVEERSYKEIRSYTPHREHSSGTASVDRTSAYCPACSSTTLLPLGVVVRPDGELPTGMSTRQEHAPVKMPVPI